MHSSGGLDINVPIEVGDINIKLAKDASLLNNKVWGEKYTNKDLLETSNQYDIEMFLVRREIMRRFEKTLKDQRSFDSEQKKLEMNLLGTKKKLGIVEDDLKNLKAKMEKETQSSKRKICMMEEGAQYREAYIKQLEKDAELSSTNARMMEVDLQLSATKIRKLEEDSIENGAKLRNMEENAQLSAEKIRKLEEDAQLAAMIIRNMKEEARLSDSKITMMYKDARSSSNIIKKLREEKIICVNNTSRK